MSDPERSLRGNDDYAWSSFDPDEYVAHYYGEPHPDDDQVLRLTCEALAAGLPGGDVVDVGTGPNLFPLFAAHPVARRLTVWEYAQSNIDWLNRTLQATELAPPWDHFWEVARAAHRSTEADPMSSLSAKTQVRQGSIYDLPQRSWDAATMFFCAESITEKQDEFERACAAFAGAVRPGGMLAAAFLAGSRGYKVADHDFPALCVGPVELERAFAPCATSLRLTQIGGAEGEIRSGYSGMIFLSARAA